MTENFEYTALEESVETNEASDYLLPSWLVHFLSGGRDRNPNRLSKRARPNNIRFHHSHPQSDVRFTISADAFRFVAYVLFWFMCIFAIFMTRVFVAPILEKGKEEDSPSCPPFAGWRANGFNVYNESHLIEAFGFNNVRFTKHPKLLLTKFRNARRYVQTGIIHRHAN